MINIFIITFLSSILGFYVFAYTYNFLSEINTSVNKHKRVIILFASLVITINNLYNNIYLKVPMTILILSIFFYLFYKDPVFKILFLSNYICLLSLMTEFILSIFLSKFVTSLDSVNSSILIKTFFSLIYFWCFYIISKLSIIKYIYKRMLEIFKNQKELIFFLYCFMFFIGITYILYSANYENKELYLFSILSITLLVIIAFFYLNEVHDNQILNIKNRYLMEHQAMYTNLIDDFRILKHNLFNDFLFIVSFCDEQVQEIIKEKMLKYKEIKSNNIIKEMRNIPEGLQGIIYFKSSIANKKNIEFHIDSNIDFEYNKINKKLYIDLCEIISISLDNALEACTKAKKKAIYFNFVETNNLINIEIYNTYNNDIDLDNIGNKNYSTKNRNSGLGLYHIKKLNKQISISNSVISDLFKIKISVKK